MHNGDVPLTVPAVTFGLTVSNAELVKTSPQVLLAFSLYLFVLKDIFGFVIVSVFIAVPLYGAASVRSVNNPTPPVCTCHIKVGTGEPPLNEPVNVAVPEVHTDWLEGLLFTVGEVHAAGIVRLHGATKVLLPPAALNPVTVGVQPSYKLQLDVVFHTKFAVAPGTNTSLVILNENRPIVFVSPIAISGAVHVKLLYAAFEVFAHVNKRVLVLYAEPAELLPGAGKLVGKSDPPR